MLKPFGHEWNKWHSTYMWKVCPSAANPAHNPQAKRLWLGAGLDGRVRCSCLRKERIEVSPCFLIAGGQGPGERETGRQWVSWKARAPGKSDWRLVEIQPWTLIHGQSNKVGSRWHSYPTRWDGPGWNSGSGASGCIRGTAVSNSRKLADKIKKRSRGIR